MLTFSSFSEDCDFSDFFKPTSALIHFPDTPMAPTITTQPDMGGPARGKSLINQS